MQSPDALPSESAPTVESLEQQVRYLQERLAFYEGFDLLIQDNVAHARELFRLAAQEREAAAAATERTRREIASREGALRAELEAVALALKSIEETVDTLTRRVKRALDESSPVDRNGWAPVEVPVNEAVAVVVHGVPSARIALSLQRYLASLPQVAAVSAREFAGGVLRLDARVRERLHVAHLRGWEDGLVIQTLTERPDVIEFALEQPVAAERLGA